MVDALVSRKTAGAKTRPLTQDHVPPEVHERGWQLRPVGDGAFAPPFDVQNKHDAPEPYEPLWDAPAARASEGDETMIQYIVVPVSNRSLIYSSDEWPDADLSGANLRYANLYGADLSDADLSDANLRYADLSDSDLCGANLYGADLSDADLCGADLTRACGIKVSK